MNVIQPRRLVERFYCEIWNKGDEQVAREIIDPSFRFRGSLGPERLGQDGFINYMRSIRAALADFQCIIDDLIETDTRAAARMRFKGIHHGQLFGVDATGREIVWSGAAFFAMKRSRITDLWVLGDIDAVKRQLGAGLVSSFAGQE
jgi:predicted ester cyclase